MEELINRYFRWVSIFSVLIPILVGLRMWRPLKYGAARKLLFLFTAISLIFEGIAYTTSYYKIDNLHFLHIYTIIEFSMIVYLFSKAEESFFPIKAKHILVIGFAFFALLNGLFIEGFKHFNANVRTIESLILIFLSLLFFYKILQDSTIRKFERRPMFWIGVAVLIYFSGNLLTFLLSEYALSSKKMSYLIWSFHALINIIKNILFAIALWVQPFKPTSPSF